MDDLTEELIRAAREGDAQGVDAALKNGANINFLGKGGWAALHHAAFEGNVDMTRLLISYGADVGVSSGKKAEGGVTPLHLAAEAGFDLVMEALLEAGADMTARDINGFQPIHWATTQVTALAVLLRHGCNLSAQASDLSTPLHHAATDGKLEVVKWLVQNGADCTIKDKDGRLAMDRAKKRRHGDVVDYLKKTKSRSKSSLFGTMRKSFRKQKPSKENRRSSEPNLPKKSASQPNLLSTSSKSKSAEEPHEEIMPADSPDLAQSHYREEVEVHDRAQSQLDNELYQKDALIAQLQSEKEVLESELYRQNLALTQTQQAEDKVRNALIGVLGRLRNEEGDGREDQPMVLNLETQVKELEHHLERQKQELVNHQEQARQYAEELEVMKNLHQGEMDSLARQVEELQSQLEWERKERSREQVESQQRLEPMQFEVENFRRTMVDLEDQVRELQQHLEGQQREHSRLQTSANQRIQELQAENDEYKKTRGRLEERTKYLEEHQERLQSAAQGKEAALIDQLSEVKKENDGKRDIISTLEQEINQLKFKINIQEETNKRKVQVNPHELNKTDDTKNHEIASLRKEKEELKKMLKEGEGAKEELQNKLDELQERFKSNEKELLAVQKEKQELLLKLKKNEEDIQKMEDRLLLVTKQRETLLKEREGVMHQLEEVKKDKEEFARERERVTKERDEAARERDELMSENERLLEKEAASIPLKSDVFQNKEDKEKDLKKQNQELQEKLKVVSEFFQNKQTHLREKYEKRKEEVQSLQKELEELKNAQGPSKGSQKVEVDSDAEKISQMRDEVQHLQDDLARCEKELEEVKATLQEREIDHKKEETIKNVMISKLEEEVEELSLKLKDNEKAINFQKELREKVTELKVMENQLKDNVSTMSTLQRKNVQLTKRIKNLEQEQQAKENEYLEMEQTYKEQAKDFERKICNLEQDLKECKETITKYEKEERYSEQAPTQASMHTIASLQVIVQDLSSKLRNADEKFVQKQQEHDQQRKLSEDRERTVISLQCSVKDLSAKLQEAEMKFREKAESLEEVERENKQIREEIIVLRDRCEHLSGELDLKQKQQEHDQQRKLSEDRERTVISLQCSVKDLSAKLQEAEMKFRNCMLEKMETVNEIDRLNKNKATDILAVQNQCEELSRQLAHAKNKLKEKEKKHESQEEANKRVIARLREETTVLLKRLGEQESAIRKQVPVYVEEYSEEVEEGMWRETESQDYVADLPMSSRGRQGITVSTSTSVKSRGVVSTSQITQINPRRRSPSPSSHQRGEEHRHRSRSVTPPRTPPCDRLALTSIHRARSNSASNSSFARQEGEEERRRPSRSTSVPRRKVCQLWCSVVFAHQRFL
ncbi:trichohyalin-like isoform X2 [Penaeus japonicus]|uniref:trichohyalin-like isoform X2 n=1 Tax=Penaeus japonicus TaxID=27405 RepID=UPI001C70C2CD|nr:trichohyalin-like isoform X2 [Penaeus japonicus]